MTSKQFWPDQIIVELSTRCNLRCVMCAINEDERLQKGGSRYGDLDIKALRNLEPVLHRIKRIDINGHGESLMNPIFLEVLEKMKKSVPEVGMTTNALMITDKVARAIVENGMNEIIVSIHAAEEDLYREISGNGSLANLKKNLKRLNEYKKQYGTELPGLKIQFVAMKRNIDQVEKMLDLAGELGATDLSLLPLVEYSAVQDESLSKHPDLIKRYISAAIGHSKKVGVRLHIPPDYLREIPRSMAAKNLMLFLEKGSLKNIRDFLRRRANAAYYNLRKSKDEQSARNCLDPWNLFFVERNGDVLPCCMIGRSMGNIIEQKFEDVWFGNRYRELREDIITGNPPRECVTCVNRPMTTLSHLKSMVSAKEKACVKSA